MKHRHRLGIAVVAGAMLLAPSLVGAHSATGPCADCHTMHNSQNGAPIVTDGPQPNLLKYDCKGCHARTWNDANGRAATAGPYAPQVGSEVPSSIYENSGGYFSIGVGEDGRTHNVADLFLPATDTGADALMTGYAPGGGTSFAINNGSGAPLLVCTSCHDLAIGHAPAGSGRVGNSSSSYRMLQRGGFYVSGTGNSNYEASGAGQNMYDAASMNTFCATCHGLFHGAGTGSSGAWVRHPTGVATSGILNGPDYAGNLKIVPVGGAGSTNLVMCLSCHRPHGNANPDMLRFSYDGTSNQAGDATESLGCETCHGTK